MPIGAPPGRRGMATAPQPAAENAESTEPIVVRRQIIFGLVTVFSAYFIYMYYFQILLAAFPRIAAELDGMRIYPWGVSIPMLGLAFSMLIAGKLSDLYGRRALLLGCLGVTLAGAIWCATSQTFVTLIIARTLLSIGQGGLAPVCFSAIGDMFAPAERGKWIGLLNVPAAIFSFFGPTLGGWLADNFSWRYIFWCGVPVLGACLVLAFFGLSKRTSQTRPRIDGRGALLAALASSTIILAFSLAGTLYPWVSKEVIGLFAASALFWALFLKAEAVASEPIFDLEVLKNRSFATIATACLLSSFGMSGLMIYYPLLMQGVQGATTTLTGQIMTPGNVLMNVLSVGAGFIIARTRRYKWMYLLGYGLTAAVMTVVVVFDAGTPIMWSCVAFGLAGFGMGAIPTVNTLVAQYAVPQRLLGVAMGGLFFTVMLGQAIAPAIMGSAMNMSYNRALEASLPAEMLQLNSQLGDSSVLLSEESMASLRSTINDEATLKRTVSAIRGAMEAGLRAVFIIGAVTMLLTFLTICTLPEISIGGPTGEAGQ